MAGTTATRFQFEAFLTWLLKGTPTYSRPSSFWVGLFTVAPNLITNTSGTEVSTSGTAYERVNIAASAWGGPSGDYSVYSNTSAIVWPNAPTGNWGTIVGAGLFDASTSGNLCYYAALQTAKTVNNGDGAPRIEIGQFQVSRAT
jgi:hypothetical protein